MSLQKALTLIIIKMKKNNKKAEVETKVIEQPKVETVVETPKKKRKHYRKPKKVQVEPVVETPVVEEVVPQNEPTGHEFKPTFKDWVQAIRFGWTNVPGFFNKIKWTYNLIKLNK